MYIIKTCICCWKDNMHRIHKIQNYTCTKNRKSHQYSNLGDWALPSGTWHRIGRGITELKHESWACGGDQCPEAKANPGCYTDNWWGTVLDWWCENHNQHTIKTYANHNHFSENHTFASKIAFTVRNLYFMKTLT